MTKQNKPVEYKSVRELIGVVRDIARKRMQGYDKNLYLFQIRDNPAIYGSANEEACLGVIKGGYHNNAPMKKLRSNSIALD